MAGQLDIEERDELRRAVIREMGNAARTLAALKAGENMTLADLRLPWEQRGLTPLEKAQMYYDHLKAVLASFDEGAYGRCERCAAALSMAELAALPWATRCRACAGR